MCGDQNEFLCMPYCRSFSLTHPATTRQSQLATSGMKSMESRWAHPQTSDQVVHVAELISVRRLLAGGDDFQWQCQH